MLRPAVRTPVVRISQAGLSLRVRTVVRGVPGQGFRSRRCSRSPSGSAARTAAPGGVLGILQLEGGGVAAAATAAVLALVRVSWFPASSVKPTVTLMAIPWASASRMQLEPVASVCSEISPEGRFRRVTKPQNVTFDGSLLRSAARFVIAPARGEHHPVVADHPDAYGLRGHPVALRGGLEHIRAEQIL